MKKMNMETILTGLEIHANDIVLVNGHYLVCDENYALGGLNCNYDKHSIADLVLGMLIGTYAYEVYSLAHRG